MAIIKHFSIKAYIQCYHHLSFFINDRFSLNLYYEYFKKIGQFKFIVLGLVVSVLVFYFKDLSLALGQTDRIPQY